MNTAERKSININLMPVQDLAFARAHDVNGRTVERTWHLGDSHKSEARILLADKVDVTLSVQPAKDRDEAIAPIRQLDLAGIERFAKTM